MSRRAPVADQGREAAGVRVDVWLWAARWFKTRSLAKQAVEQGRIGVNGQTCKPSRTLRVGDELQISRAQERYVVTVLGLTEARGPATVAQTLYEEGEASRMARISQKESQHYVQRGYQKPAKRPDKRARMQIKRLQGEW